MGKPSVTASGIFYTRKQFIESYARKSGRDTANIHYYTTFATFKLAVICQQIYYRFKKGRHMTSALPALGHILKS